MQTGKRAPAQLPGKPFDYDGDGVLDRVQLVWRAAGDPRQDLVLTRGLAEGGFASPETLLGDFVTRVEVADVDRDGNQEIVVATYDALIVLYATRRDPVVLPLRVPPWGLDVVEDRGKVSILVRAQLNTIIVFGVNRQGDIVETNRLRGSGVHAISDFDRDGISDLVFIRDGAFVVAFRNFAGDIQTVVELPSEPSGVIAKTADLNEDGYPDLVTAWPYVNVVRIHLSAGHRRFVSTTFPLPLESVRADQFELLDVNMDGHIDLVLTPNPSNWTTIATFAGIGDGTFRSASFVEPRDYDPWARYVGVRDFDGNGTIDLNLDAAGLFAPACATTIRASVAPLILAGQRARVLVTVSGVDPAVPPAGSVTITEDGIQLAAAPIDANGNAVLEVANLAPGEHTLLAHFTGNDELAPATSAAIVQKVTATPTRVEMSIAPQHPTAGDLVTISHPFGPCRVIFDGVESRRCRVQIVPDAGTHTVVAVFDGDAHRAPGQSTTTFHVAKARTAFTLHPGVPTGAAEGETFWLHYWLHGRGSKHPTGSVTVFEGNTAIATVQIVNEVISIPLKLDAGTHDLRLVYAGDVNFEPVETTFHARFGANRRRALR